MNLYAIRVIELLLQVLIFVGGRISAVSLVAGLATWFVWRDSAVAKTNDSTRAKLFWSP